jgi:t-SNARE complex subunit (syntaxin)
LEGEEGGAFFSKEVIEARREGELKTPQEREEARKRDLIEEM